MLKAKLVALANLSERSVNKELNFALRRHIAEAEQRRGKPLISKEELAG